MKLLKCKACKGTGQVACCGGHMCSGTTECYVCDGIGKVLSKKDRALKKKLEELMKYK
jgi:RecJ-like exonuclease